MFFLQAIGDTTNGALGASIAEMPSYNGGGLDFGPLLLPFILLLVFSALKCLVAVGVDKIDAIDFLAEMAIDLLSIFSSFIIGRFLIVGNEPSQLLLAFKILGFMALCVIVLCLFRRKVMDLRNSTKHVGRISGWIVGEYLLDFACLLSILYYLRP